MQRHIAFIALAILMVLVTTGSANAQETQSFHTPFDPLTLVAVPSGAQEVPEVTTNTGGGFLIVFSLDLSSAQFWLNVADGVEITQAHLHCAAAGVNGPVIAFVFGPANPPVDVDGRLSEGTLTNDDIITRDCNGLEVNNIASLAYAATQGLIYVNVHSVAHPNGVVRGQLID